MSKPNPYESSQTVRHEAWVNGLRIIIIISLLSLVACGTGTPSATATEAQPAPTQLLVDVPGPTPTPVEVPLDLESRLEDKEFLPLGSFAIPNRVFTTSEIAVEIIVGNQEGLEGTSIPIMFLIQQGVDGDGLQAITPFFPQPEGEEVIQMVTENPTVNGLYIVVQVKWCTNTQGEQELCARAALTNQASTPVSPQQ